MGRRIIKASLIGLTSLVAAAVGPARADGDRQSVILHCSAKCDGVVNSVRGIGGELDYKFDNIDAISVQLDRSRLPELSTIAGIKAVYKETVVDAPAPVEGNPRKSF